MSTIARDVVRFGFVTPNPTATLEWDREVDAFRLAQKLNAHKSASATTIAARLVEATTSDPAYNLFDDEVRAISTTNPFHAAFKQFYGDKSPVAHYSDALRQMTGRHVSWNEETRTFKLGDRAATIDHLDF
jgi:hypothetical protein